MLERHPDVSDEASEVTLARVQAAEATRKRPPEPFEGEPSPEDLICTICEDEEIPVKRRKLGYTTCLTCAERLERQENLTG